MKKIILLLVTLFSMSAFAENVRVVSYTASRSSCSNAVTVAANKCLSGDFWGAIRNGEVRKLNLETASEKMINGGLCEVTINCVFRLI